MVYYSHVNEDNRVERNILRTTSCKNVVAVAGSGERVLALMDEESCAEFHVVDVNPEALYLFELKLVALEFLYVEEYLAFIGHYPSSKQSRLSWFERIGDQLSDKCRGFFIKNIRHIENGILYMGHFEKFLNRVRKPVNFFLGNNFKNVIKGDFDKKTFPSFKWNMICRLFSARFIYKVYGNKDQAFTGKDALTRHIPLAITQTIRQNKAHSSFMVHLVFRGHLRDMKEKDLPPSLNKMVLSRIKHRLSEKQLTVHFHENDLLSFAKKNTSRIIGPVFYSASDILSFEDHEYLVQLVDTVAKNENVVVWRAFLRNRTGKKDLMKQRLLYKNSIDHSGSESTGMYQVFSLQNQFTNATG